MRLLVVRAETLKEKKSIEKILRKYKLVSYEITRTKEFYKFEILTNLKISGEVIKDLTKVGFGKSFKKGVTVIPVEAAMPSLKKKEYTPKISDTEIKQDINEQASTNWVYLSFVGLASIIIGLGLMSDNFIALIGGMLISPMLYPIIGSSYHLLLGYMPGFRKTFVSEMWGITMSIFGGLILALLLPSQPYTDILLDRSYVSFFDVGVAIFAGAAGALSVATRQLGGFSGVAIAVALMPPAVVTGIGLGYGDLSLFTGALLLTAINIAAIHGTSSIVFSILGYVNPRKNLKNNHSSK